MGIFDKANEKARERQGDAVRQEAIEFNSQLISLESFSNSDTASEFLKRIWERNIDDEIPFQAFQFFQFQNRGIQHAYFQPYDGMRYLPGEHHLLLKGTLDEAIILRKVGMMGNKKWECPNQDNLATMFNGSQTLGAKTNDLKWEWDLGISTYKLKWTIQIRPVGNNMTHISMFAGRYGGLTTIKVGFGTFLNLCATLMKVLRDDPSVGAKDFIVPTTFGSIFEQQVIWKEIPPSQ